MAYLIQHGKIRSQTINVPAGLPELLSDITREVLRCQPTTECLCQFIIDYLHSLIVAREKARMAKMAIDRALRIVDEIVADMCICDIQPTKAEKMCAAMEECFKRFLAQRRCEIGQDVEIIKFNEVDMLDELIKKCKFSEEELKISRPVIETAYQKFVDAYMSAHENFEGTEALYQYFREREIKRVEEQKRQEAALKIQSNFRGFLVRRSMFLPKDADGPAKEPSNQNLDLIEQEEAARKIQRFFRHRIQQNIPKDDAPTEEYVFQDVCEPESRTSLKTPPNESKEPEQKTLHEEKQNEPPQDANQSEILQANERPSNGEIGQPDLNGNEAEIQEQQ
ncbi:uncharacterized protein LOC101899643 isoform X1 [Musca domestica]|uniref:Uncharacterized protein LOC101899643 isoform X1 n=1 Tax=Musca domestica TaxID=7370 RepID=A0A9J7CWB5_MUSDO|nr:uncharacterized protein LOC101899643 isoform X1 [Musca domestica]